MLKTSMVLFLWLALLCLEAAIQYISKCSWQLFVFILKSIERAFSELHQITKSRAKQLTALHSHLSLPCGPSIRGFLAIPQEDWVGAKDKGCGDLPVPQVALSKMVLD